jgi:cytoskeletal protein CcmA (bactofilin family)
MATTDKELRFSGAGSAAGGSYSKVSVSGAGHITGDLECESLSVSGSVVCEGDVKTGSMRVDGSAEVQGDAVAATAVVNGGAILRGNFEVQKLKIAGAAEIDKRLSGGQVNVQGALTVGGDCEVELFKASGAFTIGGLLSADTIDVKMYGRSKATEIGGESVSFRYVKRPIVELAVALKMTEATSLEAGSVEGDRVFLERAKVGTVRGRDVELGEGCDVDLVEYTGEFRQSSSAKVKAARKVEPPAEPQA